MLARRFVSRLVVVRALAVFLATSLVFQLGQVRAAPGDIFTQAAPVIGADPAKAAELRTGDASVSTQTGALSYSYPIQVPPGRQGMAPSLALAYSSQAPSYGGIAAGWSLPLGMIRQDTSRGRIAAGSDNRFLVGESRLVEVTEPKAADVLKTYRIANGDTSYTRYERLIPGAVARWRARSTDGSVSLYGETGLITNKCEIDDFYAPLTRTTDVFGNEVKYEYGASLNPECRITKITWGQNASAGMPNPFAQVVFNWLPGHDCVGSSQFRGGAQLDYRIGRLVLTGASKLTSIVATAFPPGSPTTPDHTRTIALTYTNDDTDCAAPHSPVRLLSRIQESAVGTDSPLVTLPAVEFDYGDPAVTLNTASTQPPWYDPIGNANNLAWGYRFTDDRTPTIEAMLLDFDGDGLLDRVFNTSNPGSNGACTMQWQRNLGVQSGTVSTLQGFFGGLSPVITLPRLKWRGNAALPAASATADTTNAKEGCSLNGQVTAYENSYDPGQGQINNCHPGRGQGPGANPNNPGPYCFPGGTAITPTPGNGPSGYFRTQFSYRWLDMDADGLVDLVAAVHGDSDRYDIDRGNMTAIPPPPNGDEGTFTWPACPASSVARCKNISAQCATAARSCPVGGTCTVNQSALDACVAAAPSLGCYELLKDIPPPQTPVPPPNTPPTPTVRAPYSRCEGLYPWFIYKNKGNGTFEAAPLIKYQPVQLESDTGDSNISGKNVMAQRHAVMDFDGDGILDVVARPRPTDGVAPWYWLVWLGDGTGGFSSTFHLFQTRNDPYNNLASVSQINSLGMYEDTGLFDINGDGLSDHWFRYAGANNTPGNANFAMNLGRELELIGSSSYGPTGRLDTFTTPTSAVPLGPANDSIFAITAPSQWSPGMAITAGNTTSRQRMVDVDSDGRVDLVRAGSPPQVHFNVGGQFMASSVAYPGFTIGFERLTTAAPSGFDLRWALNGDLVDLDGDGLAEAVKFDPSSALVQRYVRDPGPPPRLLSAVRNNRGGSTTVTYAQMHDPAAVIQSTSITPGSTWFDGRPKATPRTQWVVRSLGSTDSFSNTNSTTSYKYTNPRHGADDEGRYAFRGFEEVTTTMPSGAQTLQRYSYAPDWSGRLTETVTMDSSLAVKSMSTSTWTSRTLFGGAVTAFYPTTVKQRTCTNANSTETLCIATPAAYTQTDSTLVDYPLASTPTLLTLETGTLLKKQAGNADGDRQTIRTFDTLTSGTEYKVRPRTVVKEHRVGGTMTMFAKSDQTWDPTLAFNLTNEVWFDTNDASRAISRAVYDATGNVLEKWKPIQNAANTVKTVLTYDARKLFVATETNELGHQRDYRYEYGTGALLQTDGPDVRTCTTCDPPTPSQPLKEQTKIRVDGLGRSIEHWETTSDDGSNFFLYQRQATSYVDTWLYQRLRHFRAGIEGIISFLKRCFGWDRCAWRSYESFRAYTWGSVIAANLVMLARHTLG